MEAMLVRLWAAHVPELLFVAAVVLVLIDYFFPVDYPAFLGYVCFAAGMFFVLPFGIGGSTACAALIFVGLLLLHRVWFSRFLTNAHPT